MEGGIGGSKMLHSKNERDNNNKADGLIPMANQWWNEWKCSLRRTFRAQEDSNFKSFLQGSSKRSFNVHS